MASVKNNSYIVSIDSGFRVENGIRTIRIFTNDGKYHDISIPDNSSSSSTNKHKNSGSSVSISSSTGNWVVDGKDTGSSSKGTGIKNIEYDSSTGKLAITTDDGKTTYTGDLRGESGDPGTNGGNYFIYLYFDYFTAVIYLANSYASSLEALQTLWDEYAAAGYTVSNWKKSKDISRVIYTSTGNAKTNEGSIVGLVVDDTAGEFAFSAIVGLVANSGQITGYLDQPTELCWRASGDHKAPTTQDYSYNKAIV